MTARVGSAPGPAKKAVGWWGEKLAGCTLRQHAGTFESLATLALGILGKLAR